MRDETVKCACGGLCDGICKSQHLHRKRKFGDICPAAFRSGSEKHYEIVETNPKKNRKKDNRKSKSWGALS